MTIQTDPEIAKAHYYWQAYMYLSNKYTRFLEELPDYKGGHKYT